MANYVNIAAYKFVALSGLKTLRENLLELAKLFDLKGTILISEEGINLFLAGSRESTNAFWQQLTTKPEFSDLTCKESPGDHQPFTRLLVKIKKEIIAFGVDGIEPARYTSNHLDAQTLKQWLDEGREIELLDTRNDYEVDLGTFHGALRLDIDHFKQFPDAAKQLDESLKKKTIVTFCTGGIRCEKAAPYLETLGFEDVHQLDGGILKYFEECGGDHYDGECFVFDHRVGVDADLNETETKMCFVCQQPLTPVDQQSQDYVEAVSCPHCINRLNQNQCEGLRQRESSIANCVRPLPGSIPYDNSRPLKVAEKYKGWRLLDWVCDLFAHLSRASWTRVIDAGRIQLNGDTAPSDYLVAPGQVFQHLFPDTIEPDVNVDIRIVHEDEAIFVVDKPAPLPMHPCGRYNRNSLTWILNQVYRDEKPRMAHRLDANTSGLVVFARKRKFAALVQPQFEKRTVGKKYLALVHGHPTATQWVCDQPISMVPGQSGLRGIEKEGADARTEFSVIEYRNDNTALIEAVPITGRTNQIRIHLWAGGYPVVGDPCYRSDHQLGSKHTLSITDPPMCLHSARIELIHPLTDVPVAYESLQPRWTDSRVESIEAAI